MLTTHTPLFVSKYSQKSLTMLLGFVFSTQFVGLEMIEFIRTYSVT